MIPEITVQLYSLREQFAENFEKTLDAVRSIGFENVEPAGYHGLTPKEFRAQLDQRGLKAPSAHCGLPVGEDANEIIDAALEIGIRYLISGVPPGGQENYQSLDRVHKMADLYAEAADKAEKHGLLVGYHNHDWDLCEIDGQRAYQIFLEKTPDSVFWEADVFWVARAGIDPAEFVRELGQRARLLHLKDGAVKDLSLNPPFLPCGEGDVDLKAAASAGKYTEFAAVELDAYNGDMLEAIEKSYQYLTQNGLAQ